MSSIKIELVLFLLASDFADFGYNEDMNFEYIEDVKGYTISSHKKRVKPMLVDQRGHVYQRITFSKNTPKVYWGCEKRRQKSLPCRANLVSLHNKIISIKGTHNHSPPASDLVMKTE